MRDMMTGLWFIAFIAVGVNADEVTSGQTKSAQSQVDGSQASESKTAEPSTVSEAEADAEIRQIEAGVRGEDDVKEFIPKKPLSADKAIALPSDI